MPIRSSIRQRRKKPTTLISPSAVLSRKLTPVPLAAPWHRDLRFDLSGMEIGKNRIEALSDGIFAIAMTLLVLEFHVPSLPADAPNVEVLPAMLALWPKFLSYVVAFVSLGFFWVGHHVMYHIIRRADRVLLWLNIVFFMFVSFLPFSTSVLNAFPEAFIAPLFFGANLTTIGWVLFSHWTSASSQPAMSPALSAQNTGARCDGACSWYLWQRRSRC